MDIGMQLCLVSCAFIIFTYSDLDINSYINFINGFFKNLRHTKDQWLAKHCGEVTSVLESIMHRIKQSSWNANTCTHQFKMESIIKMHKLHRLVILLSKTCLLYTSRCV